jgi:hypothetical protein
MTNEPALPKRQLGWMHVGLGLLAVVGVLLGLVLLALGLTVQRVNQQQSIIAEIKGAGGQVTFEHFYSPGGPPGPALLRALLGDDAFGVVHEVRLPEHWNDPDLTVLRQWPKIAILEVEGEISPEGIAVISELQTLEDLDLRPGGFTAEDLRRLGSLPKLRLLGLSGGVNHGALLPALDALPQLETLRLWDSDIVGSDLASLKHVPALERLYVSSAKQLTDDDLIHIGKLLNLKRLALMETAIAGEGLIHLAGLQQVSILDLQGSPIQDGTVTHLAEMQSLSYLDLSATQITDASCATLARLTSLRNLQLKQTAITDEGLAQLEALPNLYSLRVGPNVTREAARKFQEANPECAVRIITSDGSLLSPDEESPSWMSPPARAE